MLRITRVALLTDKKAQNYFKVEFAVPTDVFGVKGTQVRNIFNGGRRTNGLYAALKAMFSENGSWKGITLSQIPQTRDINWLEKLNWAKPTTEMIIPAEFYNYTTPDDVVITPANGGKPIGSVMLVLFGESADNTLESPKSGFLSLMSGLKDAGIWKVEEKGEASEGQGDLL